MADRKLSQECRQVLVLSAIGEPLYLSYARQFRASEELARAQDKNVRLVCKLYIHLLGAYLCNLDLEASRARVEKRAPQGRPLPLVARLAAFRGLAQSEWRRRLRFGWLYWAMFAWYICSLAFLSVYSYYQYKHDVHLLRLQALDRLEPQQQHTPPVVDRTSIAGHMAESRRVLDLLGSEFAHLTVVVEAIFVILVSLTAIITLPVLFHHTFRRPFDQYHLVRDLLDSEREHDTLRRMTERQTAQFLTSSQEFYQNAINFHPNNTIIEQQQHAEPSSHVGFALRRERQARHLVREMLSTGALTPLLKLQPGARWRVRALCALFLMITEGILSAYVVLIYGFLSQVKPNATSPHLSRSILFAWLGPLAFTAGTVILHPPLAVVVTHEQIHYVAELRRMVKRCIELNSTLVCLHSAQHDCRRATPAREQLEHTLNSNLLFVLLHYKIFVAQLRPLTLSLGVASNTWLALMLLWPALMRLHQPYLNKLHISWLSSSFVKAYEIVVSVSLMGEAMVVSGPLCYLYSRCQDLYKDLASLAAHTSEAKLKLTPEGATSVYDAHTQSCLLLELADSRRFLQPLTVTAAGVSSTYATILRALFWYGIAIISILTEKNSCSDPDQSLVIKFLNDPLGVYSQIKCT